MAITNRTRSHQLVTERSRYDSPPKCGKKLYLEGGSSFGIVWGSLIGVTCEHVLIMDLNLFQIEAACGPTPMLLFRTLSNVADHRLQLFI